MEHVGFGPHSQVTIATNRVALPAPADSDTIDPMLPQGDQDPATSSDSAAMQSVEEIPELPTDIVMNAEDLEVSCLRTRSLSKAALMEEAMSEKHVMSHFPHNPYCPVC